MAHKYLKAGVKFIIAFAVILATITFTLCKKLYIADLTIVSLLIATMFAIYDFYMYNKSEDNTVFSCGQL